jgi:hypothetical protein
VVCEAKCDSEWPTDDDVPGLYGNDGDREFDDDLDELYRYRAAHNCEPPVREPRAHARAEPEPVRRCVRHPVIV